MNLSPRAFDNSFTSWLRRDVKPFSLQRLIKAKKNPEPVRILILEDLVIIYSGTNSVRCKYFGNIHPEDFR
jgi:hypothetical protein